MGGRITVRSGGASIDGGGIAIVSPDDGGDALLCEEAGRGGGGRRDGGGGGVSRGTRAPSAGVGAQLRPDGGFGASSAGRSPVAIVRVGSLSCSVSLGRSPRAIGSRDGGARRRETCWCARGGGAGTRRAFSAAQGSAVRIASRMARAEPQRRGFSRTSALSTIAIISRGSPRKATDESDRACRVATAARRSGSDSYR